MTDQERQEFSTLKQIRSQRGFFLEQEKIRWNYLFDKLAKKVINRIKQEENACRIIDSN